MHTFDNATIRNSERQKISPRTLRLKSPISLSVSTSRVHLAIHKFEYEIGSGEKIMVSRDRVQYQFGYPRLLLRFKCALSEYFLNFDP